MIVRPDTSLRIARTDPVRIKAESTVVPDKAVVTLSDGSATEVACECGEMSMSADDFRTAWQTSASDTLVSILKGTDGAENMSAQAGTVQARIRKVKSSRASDWATSDTVTTIAQPLAPSVRVACDPLAIGSAQVVSWATNHPDGSAQSAAQVELTPPTGTAVVTDVTDATTSLSIPASSIAATGGYRVRVRTHGVWDGWGAWSSYASFVAATLPDVAFSAPPATVSAMSDCAADVLSVAAGEVGYCAYVNDADTTGTKYGRFYADLTGEPYFGGDDVAWCAMFVSWVFAQAGATCPGIPKAYVP